MKTRLEHDDAGVLKIGRTEMQDAVPVTLGQEFAAWPQAVQGDWWRLWCFGISMPKRKPNTPESWLHNANIRGILSKKGADTDGYTSRAKPAR
ncbi:MAG: hypothetical protein A2Z18_11475 [Armatimonadetes bacterium RBG_16_58_9]|nr:MAG: hypothetical protein A2Z18_11475 [Armatimonadetes bacterium RBG_16_58_9]